MTACDFCHLPVPSARAESAPADGVPDTPVYCCYGCSFAAAITRARGEEGHAKWMLTRVGLSVFLSMIVMMFSMYLYRQEFVDAAAATPLSLQLAGVMRYLCLLFSTPVFILLGWPIFAAALEAGRRRSFSTDALVVAGVAAAMVYSYISTLRDQGAVYYETVCAVLVFMTLGRYLEASGKLRASAAVTGLASLFPDEVEVVRSGQQLRIAAKSLAVDDVMFVPAGRRIAADGIVVEGKAHVDESIVTGECVAVVREAGGLVRAGTLNLDGTLRVRASQVGADSTLGRLESLLNEARQSRSKWERIADRIARYFLPTTLVLAAVAVTLGTARAGIDRGIMTGLSVLLIACPCALGLATPMAIWVAMGRAARRGVLFRRGESLERLAAAQAVCFDKTGTLTTGEPVVNGFHSPPAENADSILRVVAGLVAGCDHLLSRGIRSWIDQRRIEPAVVTEIQTIAGRGLVGMWNDSRVAIGNLALMRDESCEITPQLDDAIRVIRESGQPIACIGWNGSVRGVFQFAEQLRTDARSSIHDLIRQGLTVTVLTGDHAGRAAAIARELGVSALGEQSPPDKTAYIRALRRDGARIAMVGDGLNDAPALAASDVGIAMGCGADLTRDSGEVCLLGNDPAILVWTIRLARQTVRAIKLNLLWAFGYNLIGVGLALTGRLNPIFAASAMVISSVVVVANSLRIGAGANKSTPAVPIKHNDPLGPAEESAIIDVVSPDRASAGVAA